MSRNIGIGKDLANFFKNRNCKILYIEKETKPNTFVIETDVDYDELLGF